MLALAIIGIILTVVFGAFGVVPYISLKGKLRLRYWRFKRIFGVDAFRGQDFHAVTTEYALRLTNGHDKFFKEIQLSDGRRIEPVYIKLYPKRREPGTGVSGVRIENPLSGGGARALSYVTALMHENSREPISTSLDYDLDRRMEEDISFVSFGGPLANWYTYYALTDEANDLVEFREHPNESCFVDPRDDSIIERLTPDTDYDCGLILKLHPKKYPKRTWLVCAGFGEWGTSGAAWYLANRWEKEIHPLVKKDPFAIVVHTTRGEDSSAHRSTWGKVSTSTGPIYLP